MNWIDYRKKLGLDFSEHKQQTLFVTRFLNNLGNANIRLSDSEFLRFCNYVGISYTHESRNMSRVFAYMYSIKDNFSEMIFSCIALINCIDNAYIDTINELVSLLEKCLDETGILYETLRDDDEYFLFPKGASELDVGLITKPLDWLYSYPSSREAFIRAIKKYSDALINDPRTIADEFRKALEEFFQEFFKSTKSIENLKSEYGHFMKSHGVPGEVSNTLQKLLDLYNDYMNSYVKHHNNTNKNVLEYIMYQTGNIIRLLITLKNSEDK